MCLTKGMCPPICRNLPRAALAGIFLSALIYILVNVSYFVVLTGDDILTSPTIALVSCILWL